jgi:broad-specificity NMP kinase
MLILLGTIIMNIFFITGPSGSGKTTVVQHLKKTLPSNHFAVYDFDENGVPYDADKTWRIKTTDFWLQKAQGNYKEHITTIICGVSVPSEITQLIRDDNYNIVPYFGFIQISDELIEKRLQERGWNPQLIEDNIGWAHHLEKEVDQQNNHLFVNGSITPEEVAYQFASWITSNTNE